MNEPFNIAILNNMLKITGCNVVINFYLELELFIEFSDGPGFYFIFGIYNLGDWFKKKIWKMSAQEQNWQHLMCTWF